MGFSPSQQGVYRPLVTAAWALHCERSGADKKDKSAYAAWYAAELKKATGQSSSKLLNKGRHYERACAHFEALADAGIKHQLALLQGDLWRIRHAVSVINRDWLLQFANDAALDTYAKAIAAQAFRDPALELYQLTDPQIEVVTRAIRIDAHRALAA